MTTRMIAIGLTMICLISGCAGKGPRKYVGPRSGPTATVNLFAPTIQSSAANSEVDFEIFTVQSDCSLKSLGSVQLTPTRFNTPIAVVGEVPLFFHLTYFQTDIVLARNSRGEVKFALEPSTGKNYTVEYKGTGSRFDMDIWEGKPSNKVQGKLLEPLEWNERNGKIVYRGNMPCSR